MKTQKVVRDSIKKYTIFKILAYLFFILGSIFYKNGASFISDNLSISYDSGIYLIGVIIGLTFCAIYGLADILKQEKIKRELMLEIKEVKNMISNNNLEGR